MYSSEYFDIHNNLLSIHKLVLLPTMIMMLKLEIKPFRKEVLLWVIL